MQFRDREVIFNTTKIMGILNVTPDSFSDGGQHNQLDSAIKRAEQMVDEGACFIDVGGESTRPGAIPVSLDEELDRVIPVIEKLSNSIDAVISVDTSKANVMREAVLAGASMINDVRALNGENALATAAEMAKLYKVPACIMHMQGNPQTMQNSPVYDNVADEIIDFFRHQIERLTAAGFKYHQIMLDPGFGFGKTLEHNYQILKHFSYFTQFDLPVLAGMSRKSMIGNLLNREINDRLAGDIAAVTLASFCGASVVRVHDVKETSDAMKIVDKTNSVD